ncbi:uncharacterized protein PAC_18024 [Phialocephala subalpina]|uniref:C2H2-type domain-containing protein n=1 Tax=Phialocephala subalpina TaxID=576137 RepID=A0A1L7XSZ9_9HELO|nr:uncharacterized protein PAC_18024 [Phialocephala subalpina]
MNTTKATKTTPKEKPRTLCTVKGCTTTFSRKVDSYRHITEVHGDAKKCPVKGCTWKNAKREGRLGTHMMNAHSDVYKPVELELELPLNQWPSQQATSQAYRSEESGYAQYSPSSSNGSPQNSAVLAAQMTYAQPAISNSTSMSGQPYPTAAWSQNGQPTSMMGAYDSSQYQYALPTLSAGASVAEDTSSYEGDRPYSCKFCSKTFKRSDVLRDHFSQCEKRGSSAIPSVTDSVIRAASIDTRIGEGNITSKGETWGTKSLVTPLPDADPVVLNPSPKSEPLRELILPLIKKEESSDGDNGDERESQQADKKRLDGRTKLEMVDTFVEEQLGNVLASEPWPQIVFNPEANLPFMGCDLEPQSVSRRFKFELPRSFGFEEPTDIQNWFQEYQSHEDMASEEGQFGYALINSNMARTRDRRPSEGNLSDTPGILNLSESMSTRTADKTDWENSDADSSHAHESANLQNCNSKQKYKQLNGHPSNRQHVLSAETMLVDRLTSEFWVLFNQYWKGGFRHRGSGALPTSGIGSNGTSSEQSSNGPSNRKRARGKRPEDPDDNDRRASKRAGKQPATETISVELQYACPYRKHNPRKYCVQDWKLCALTSHKNIARVKAHLYNYHTIHQCPRCKQLFDTAAMLEIHALAPDSCQLQTLEHIDGITSKIKEQLQCRKKAFPGQTEPERWVQIYRIIFQPKDDDGIPSPYFEPIRDEEPNRPLSPESRIFSEYEGHFRRELPRHFQAILESAVSNEIQPIEERLRRQFMGFLEEAQNRTFSSFRARFNVPEWTQIREQTNAGPMLGESSTEMLETFFRPLSQIDLGSLLGFNLSEQNFEFSNLKDDHLADSAYALGSPRPLSPQNQDVPKCCTEEPIPTSEAGPSSLDSPDSTADNQEMRFRDLEVSQAESASILATNDVLLAPNQLEDYTLMFNDNSWALNSIT